MNAKHDVSVGGGEAAREGLLEPASAKMPSTRQRLFLRYFTAILIDLTVLNLFDEFSAKVTVSSFSVSLAAAILLQVLLKATLAVEHRVAAYFNARQGKAARVMRFVAAWLVLFGSKFVILEAISFAFDGKVVFSGAFHGLITLIVVLVVMLLAEEIVVRFYRRLA
ncbi:MAG TPA: hypothetical protein VFY03_04670 [Woeseiaceae bacterium]|nr:hypothetical protein [Woeseiaceae bacterium]